MVGCWRNRHTFGYGWGLWLLLLLFGIWGGAGCQCGEALPAEKAPKLQSTPGTLVFEAISLGQKIERDVVLQNVGDAVAKIGALSLVNETSGQPFTLLTQKATPFQLEPGSSVRLQIRYEPKQAGSARGYIRVISDAANADVKGLFKIDLRSADLSATIVPTPNPLDFGIVPIHDTAKKTLTITNRGALVLEIERVSLEKNEDKEFAVVSNLSFPLKVSPGSSTTIELSYSPKKPLADSLLVLHNNTTTSKVSVRLLGQISASDIEVKPLQLDFSANLGAKSTKKFVIYNRGMLGLTINGIALDDNANGEFLLPTLPTFPLTIEANQSKEIEVVYNPRDVKDDSANVLIASNDPDAPEVKVVVTGKARGCLLQATPEKLHFTKDSVQQFTIVNQGNQPCLYKSAYFGQQTSTEFSFLIPPPRTQTLAPGQTLDFEVKYAPKDKGKDQGSVVVETDETQVALEVPLTAEVRSDKPCDIVTKPTQLLFGLVEEGKSKQLPVTLTNHGYEDCGIHAVKLTSNAGNGFSMVTQFPGAGVVLKPGDAYNITVAFTPTIAVSYTGTLQISSTDSRVKTITVSLSGSRSRLCLEVVPGVLNFGAARTGCSVGRRPVDVYNLCNTDVEVGSVALGANTNPTHKEFVIQVAPQTPFPIKPGQSTTIQVSYVPNDLGSDTGTLEITNSAYAKSAVAVALLGQGVNSDEQTDIFRQTKLPQIDILFVVDNSGSMGNDQTNLGQNLQSFFNWAATLQLDYQIGVITTDTNQKGCLVGTTKIVTPQTPKLIDVLTVNVRVGTSGSASEKGLETSYLALSVPAITGCNQGFYRQDAALSVVYISDERDQSPQPVDFYVSFLRSLKGARNPEKLRASAIGPVDEKQCQSSGSCRYYLVSKLLSGVYSHITSTNWGSTLSTLGAVTFGRYARFFLSRPADPNTIQVKVDGKVINQGANGWSYDANNNSIGFDKSATPDANATISVSYKALCLQP